MELDQQPGQLVQACPETGPAPLPGAELSGPGGLRRAPEAERRRALVAQTARFSADFLRWTEGRSCNGLTLTRLRLLQALHCGGPAIMRDLGVQLGVSPGT